MLWCLSVVQTIFMMTSSNGSIFRITVHLCGNSPITGEFTAQRPVTRSFEVFFDLGLNKRVSNNREAGDLRPQWAHYDATVMLRMLVMDISLAQGNDMLALLSFKQEFR